MGLEKQYCKVGSQKPAYVDPNLKPIVAPCEKTEGLCDPVESTLGPYKACNLCAKME